MKMGGAPREAISDVCKRDGSFLARARASAFYDAHGGPAVVCSYVQYTYKKKEG